MDCLDLLRRNPEQPDRVLPRVFRHRDQPVRAPENPLGEVPVGAEIRRGVKLRHQDAGQVVDGGGQPGAPRRMMHLVRGMENIRSGEDRVQQRLPDNVDGVEQRDPRHGTPVRKNGRVVVQRPQVPQARKG